MNFLKGTWKYKYNVTFFVYDHDTVFDNGKVTYSSYKGSCYTLQEKTKNKVYKRKQNRFLKVKYRVRFYYFGKKWYFSNLQR